LFRAGLPAERFPSVGALRWRSWEQTGGRRRRRRWRRGRREERGRVAPREGTAGIVDRDDDDGEPNRPLDAAGEPWNLRVFISDACLASRCMR